MSECDLGGTQILQVKELSIQQIGVQGVNAGVLGLTYP